MDMSVVLDFDKDPANYFAKEEEEHHPSYVIFFNNKVTLTLEEAKEYLESGGRLGIIEPDLKFHIFTKDDLILQNEIGLHFRGQVFYRVDEESKLLVRVI